LPSSADVPTLRDADQRRTRRGRAAAISRIAAAAFAQASHSSGTEPRIVDALRQGMLATIRRLM
jgi:hypothetical protein